MTPKNVTELRKKRSRASQLAELWEKELVLSVKKLKHYRRREKLYTTLIEKALQAQKHIPEKVTRVVEI